MILLPRLVFRRWTLAGLDVYLIQHTCIPLLVAAIPIALTPSRAMTPISIQSEAWSEVRKWEPNDARSGGEC
jgi:hypothetical protein